MNSRNLSLLDLEEIEDLLGALKRKVNELGGGPLADRAVNMIPVVHEAALAAAGTKLTPTQVVSPSALAERIKACIERDEQDDTDETIGALDLLREVYQALAQQAQPDYRCVMCNKPIPVGCKDCTEYAYDAVGYPQRAQPEMPTREQIEALRERVPVRTDSGNMDLAAGWCAALDTILAKWFS